MNKISDKEIDHLAKLSALNFSKTEKQEMKNDLEQILAFVDEMNNCKVAPSIFDEAEVTLDDLRDDKPKKGFSQKTATKNAPKTKNGYFIVPKVVD